MNFEFLEDIIVKEMDEEIRDSLSNIRHKGLNAEQDSFISPESCLKLCNEMCEAIVHVYMRKALPEDAQSMKDGNYGNWPDTNSIWLSECYINAFMPETYNKKVEAYTRNRKEMELYQELFKLKGEANCDKHDGKYEYRFPLIIGKNLGRWEDGPNAGKIKTIKVTLSADEYKTKVTTHKNALTRLEQTYDYLCAVLVKAGYCDRDDLTSYNEPEQYSRLKTEKVYEITSMFEEYLRSGGVIDTSDGTRKVIQTADDETRVIYEDGSMYIGDWKDGNRNGIGKYISKDGRSVYEGEWKDDKRNGKGTQTYEDGTKYEGEWREDLYNGLGTRTSTDGHYIEGEWKNGKLNGKAKFFTEEGKLSIEGEYSEQIPKGMFRFHYDTSYAEVEFINGKLDSHVKQVYKDGSVYEGECAEDLPVAHGFGIKTKGDGTVYEGSWEKGLLIDGTITYPDGSRYSGTFKDGLYNGYGHMSYSDGSRYVGNWVDGWQHGAGKMDYVDGSSYDGEWKEGEKHGRGKMIFFDGSSFEGTWKDGKISGEGTLKFIDRSYRQGEWEEDFLSGFLNVSGNGKIVYPNGGIYEGELDKNKRSGVGTMTYANKTVYEGEWSYDKQNGQGKMIYPDGSFFEGEWRYGKRKKGKIVFCDGSEYDGEWLLNGLKVK